MTKEQQEKKKSLLPDSECIIILKPAAKGGVEYDVISLDEYFGESDTDLKKQVYLKAVEKYGQVNVRYCSVVPVTLQQVVEFG